MERIKIVMQYDGTNFCGFQVQPQKRTVQGELEKVLSFLMKENVKILNMNSYLLKRKREIAKMQFINR